MVDRVPTYPGRVRLVPVSGQENVYDLTLADEPVQVGTPLSKANLLTDETGETVNQATGSTPATPNWALALLAQKMAANNTDIETLKLAVGAPLVAATSSAMTDTTKIYVYTGSQSGYTFGNWYYYNGSTWTSGGVYNSSAVQTDKTLSVSGASADAAVTGGKISDLTSESINLFDPRQTPVTSSATCTPTRTGLTVAATSSGTYRSARFDMTLESNTAYTFVGKKNTSSGDGIVGYREYTGSSWPTSLTKTLLAQSASDDTQVITTFTTGSGLIRLYFYCTWTPASVGSVDFYDVAIYKGTYSASTLPAYVRASYAQDDGARNDIGALSAAMYPLDLLTVTTIPDGTDFDTIMTAGAYNILTSAHADTMLNIPEAIYGRLNVMYLTSAQRVYQIYYTGKPAATIYIRTYTSSGWGAWKTLAYEGA